MSRTIELSHVGVSEPWESDIHRYCQSVKAIFHTASGTVMRDADGRQYIDFLSRAGSLTTRNNDPNLPSALTEYLMRDDKTHG